MLILVSVGTVPAEPTTDRHGQSRFSLLSGPVHPDGGNDSGVIVDVRGHADSST